ncbi:MAG: YggS family pyridoxal phosphate-dependent enzyme, partial [Gammaproteobacteria bacterium]|nr:YggS family pyridoxal phosphate-dependent enzyme [Gammaproteobacteria bacterium]
AEARDAGRDPGAVRLVAVSKKKPPESVREAAAAGQRDFAENFVQEGLDKITAVGIEGLRWHFIGHLQSNKSRAVAEHFDWVHTVDRLRIARRLSQQRPESLAPLNICLQVNIDNETGKSGISVAEAPELARAVAELPRLRLRGLMCLPAPREAFEAQRQPFAAMRLLAEQLQVDGIKLDTLSMGMSNDHRAAIFEGSTMVRIGTAIFGARG